MKKEIIRENGNLKENLKKLEAMGYKYIIKVNDKFLSGWGLAEHKKHIHLIACVDRVELEAIKQDIENDNTLNYFNWDKIENKKAIYAWTYNKTFTIRNDWTRYKNNK